MAQLIVKSHRKETKLRKGKTLLTHIERLKIKTNASCGGKGRCRGCLVKVLSGSECLAPLTTAEKKMVSSPIYRLACQAKILRDDINLVIEVPKYMKILEVGRRLKIPLNPFVKKKHLPPIAKVYWDGKEIGDYEGEIYGLALDVGTTTIVMYWVDLEKGKEKFIYSIRNPQVRYGNNIIDRINYAKTVSQDELERTVRRGVNEMIQQAPVNPNHIYEMVVVGNTAMRDIFMGHSVKKLGEAPFEPVSSSSIHKSASKLGININPNAYIYAPPIIGHFVGADALAVVLATEMYKDDNINMAIDIGTNTEIIIGNKDEIYATSAASGPAFEGSGLKCGCGAVEGAIQKVEMDDKLNVKYETIGDTQPIGICGSGLIDALAVMLDKGIINWRGRFTFEKREFVIYEDGNRIFLDGEDIDSLMLAKAAIYAGTRILMRRYGIKASDINKVYLAGAFGTYINVRNALKIGLLPDVPIKKIEKVGNAAVEGARQMLVSKEKREEAEYIPKIAKHVRLEVDEDFQTKFIEGLCFEKYQFIKA
jgi:uncharacterized 2Fe-2S/4Fe-4S cluster protein (DUF4445 family)